MHPLRVYHVLHTTPAADKAWALSITDMYFDGKTPVAVFEWGGKPGKEYPLVSVRLDPARLAEHRDGEATHLYDGVIEDPRNKLPS